MTKKAVCAKLESFQIKILFLSLISLCSWSRALAMTEQECPQSLYKIRDSLSAANASNGKRELYFAEKKCLATVEAVFNKSKWAKKFRTFLQKNPNSNDNGEALSNFVSSIAKKTQTSPMLDYILKFPNTYAFEGRDDEGHNNFIVKESYTFIKTLSDPISRKEVFETTLKGLPDLCHPRYEITWKEFTENACNDYLAELLALYATYPEFKAAIVSSLKNLRQDVAEIKEGKNFRTAKEQVTIHIDTELKKIEF